ncbi:Na/Pi cotransporter family protein [bacterium]|nr:Na/Pi cotransporter family protein [bacterium]
MNLDLVQLLGGSCLLIYAIGELSKSIQLLGGSQFRNWLNQSTRDKWRGVALGGLIAMLLCSSGAVTAMLVSLANARLLSLPQTLAVSLGAGIGSTLMVQLLAFKISQYGLLILALGFITESFIGNASIKRLGRVALFVGLVFFSLDVLGQAGNALRNEPVFQAVSEYMRSRPVLGFLLAAGFSALTYSSAATVTFAMSLVMAQQGTVLDALPWVLGANLGSTTTGYFASLTGDIPGKQAALGSLLSRFAGIVIFWPFQKYIARGLEALNVGVNHEVALSHLFFNLSLAVLFLPFLNWGVKVVTLMVPSKESEGPFHFQYLDRSSLATPELALAQAQRELLRLSDAVERLMMRCLDFFQGGSTQAVEQFRANDKVIDFLNKGIKRFLTSLSQGEMTQAQVDKEFEILIRTNDMENIGDIVANNIVSLVYKCRAKGYVFSREGWMEIVQFHEKVITCLRLSTAYFSLRTPGLEKQLFSSLDEIDRLSLDLTERHLRRLHSGIKQSQDSSSVHLDLLGHMTRIAHLSTNLFRMQSNRAPKQETV